MSDTKRREQSFERRKPRKPVAKDLRTSRPSVHLQQDQYLSDSDYDDEIWLDEQRRANAYNRAQGRIS